MFTLYPYQAECLNILQGIREKGLKRALIVMASGLGKTVTMAFDAKQWKDQNEGRVLLLCHNNDILYQARTTFQAVNGSDHSYGYFHGEEKNFHEVDFLFASFQTMELHREMFRPNEFDYIIVDEGHHSQAETFRSTIEYFQPQFLLGATATPDRLDELNIREIFGEEVYFLPLEEALARGLVTPVDYRLLTDEIQIAKVIETENGPVGISHLNRRIFIPQRDDEIAKIILQHTSSIESPRVMIFCNSIKHCEHLSQFLPNSFAIHSKVPERERAVKLELFRQGVVGTILTVNAFNEGVDIPQANVVVFLRSTTSRAIFLQQLGRGLRKSEGKDKVVALDFVANCERIKMVHSLWREIEEKIQQHGLSDPKDAVSPMTLNVDNVEFQETIIPLLKLMERVRPLRISEVERLAKEYSPKNPTPADQAIAGVNKKYLWCCSLCGCEWLATGNQRLQKEASCPRCVYKVKCQIARPDRLVNTHPHLIHEYSRKNSLPVTEIMAHMRDKCWWRCPVCERQWQATPESRMRGSKCPRCATRNKVSRS